MFRSFAVFSAHVDYHIVRFARRLLPFVLLRQKGFLTIFARFSGKVVLVGLILN